LAVLAAAFARWSAIWDHQGFPAIADAWRQRAFGLGEPCIARTGTDTLEGVALDLDADGALRLRLADGAIRRVSAGDVFFGGL
jgi:BirA family biotin operon repressor/biotin-[acetyl-CoA-carboxylase] ligase